MSASPTRLLRYVFDSCAQLRRHARATEGRVLLFYADPLLHGAVGEAIVLELAFAGSDQSITVGARVHARTAGEISGVWLELHGAHVMEDVRVALHTPRRKQRRVACDFDSMVRVQTARALNSVGRLIDVSVGGARLAGVAAGLIAGDEISFGELGAPAGIRARVVWARRNDLAIEFLRTDPASRAGAMKLVNAAAESWARARTLSHPAACRCESGGTVLEPFLPRAAHRRMQSV